MSKNFFVLYHYKQKLTLSMFKNLCIKLHPFVYIFGVCKAQNFFLTSNKSILFPRFRATAISIKITCPNQCMAMFLMDAQRQKNSQSNSTISSIFRSTVSCYAISQGHIPHNPSPTHPGNKTPLPVKQQFKPSDR